jgi:hypothetical protein
MEVRRTCTPSYMLLATEYVFWGRFVWCRHFMFSPGPVFVAQAGLCSGKRDEHSALRQKRSRLGCESHMWLLWLSWTSREQDLTKEAYLHLTSAQLRKPDASLQRFGRWGSYSRIDRRLCWPCARSSLTSFSITGVPEMQRHTSPMLWAERPRPRVYQRWARVTAPPPSAPMRVATLGSYTTPSVPP